jgi:glycerol-3-phosphate dehydrogenase subunit C
MFPVSGGFIKIRKDLFEGILRDEGYFSSISPNKRIMVSENVYDLGEYLRSLHKRGALDTRFGATSLRAVYYPPCHLREQRIGRPYQYLLSLIPGLSLDMISGIYCCGNGGIMGFKQEFHYQSIKIASRLMSEIKGLNPEVIATDCLSCRIQFNQLTPYKVMHPIEIIKESYNKYQEEVTKEAV